MEVKMKKLTVIFLVLFTAGSLFANGGSDKSSSKSGDAVPKTLVVTGIDGISGDVLVTIASNGQNLTGSMVAVGGAVINGNTLTVPLVIPGNESERWTGKGDYFIVLVFEDAGNAIYFYAEGGKSALKYKISEATTTIAFNQFCKI